MKRFKNILYILDKTNCIQESSAEKVANLARINQASVKVVIAGDTTIFDSLSLTISSRFAELQKNVQQQNGELLEQFLQHDRWNGIDVQASSVEVQDFISIIQNVLRDKHDLVIIEEKLDNGIGQLAMRLVRKCPCPVWVIKSDTRDFKKILAAVDVSENTPESRELNRKIVELAHSLAQREGGEAHYLHVWRLEHEAMMRGPRFKIADDEIEKIKDQLRTERSAQLQELLSDFHIIPKEDNVHIIEGKSEDSIKQTIGNLGVDVVVMGSVARTGVPGFLIGNKAEKLLNTINCTVLTVKPDGFKSPVTID